MKAPITFTVPVSEYGGRIITKITFPPLLLLFLLLGINGKAQNNLTANGETQLVSYPGRQVIDYIVSPEAGGSTIYFRLEGADGARTNIDSQNRAYGGTGATIEAEFNIGNTSNEIPVGSTIRMIIGEKGPLDSYAGGAGTGLAFRHPSTGQWTILMVAGGGGGSTTSLTLEEGRSGEITTYGSHGRGLSSGENNGTNGEDGKTSDDWARPGRGYLSSMSNGVPVGSSGPRGTGSSTWGFGGGGARRENSFNEAGGGGGGYSGGGGGRLQGSGAGGGGGSYVNTAYAISNTKTKNEDAAVDPNDGFVEYRIDCRLARNNEASITDVIFDPCDNSFGRYVMTIKTDILTSECDGLTYLVDDGNNILYNDGPTTTGERGLAYTVALAYGGEVIDQMGFTIPKFEWLEEMNFTLTIDETSTTINAKDLVDIEISSPEFKFAFLNAEGTSITGNSKSFNTGNYIEKIGLITPGGVITCQQEVTVNVIDVGPPVFQSDCIANVYVNLSQTLKLEYFDNLIVTDNVTASEDIEISWNRDETRYNCEDVAMVFQQTIYAEDEQGNISSCEATINVFDTIQPTIVCQDVTIELGVTGTANIDYVDFIASASDNCLSEAEIISGYSWNTNLLPSTVDCDDFGTYQIDLLRSTVAHETDLPPCTATLTIVDQLAPTIICENITVELNDQGFTNITDEELPITYSDNCTPQQDIIINRIDYTFTCNNIEDDNLEVEVTAIDQFNNSSSCSFKVTVVDPSTPTVLCKDSRKLMNRAGPSLNITVNDVLDGVGSPCVADVLGSVEFTAGTQITYTCADIDQDNFVTLIFTPDNGAPTSSCTARITPYEDDAPIMSCPGLIQGGLRRVQVNAQAGLCGGAVYNFDLNPTDNCGVTSIIQDQGLPSGATYPYGETLNSITVSDASGNSNNCTFVVEVRNAKAPTVNCPDDLSIDLEGESCGLVLDPFPIPIVLDDCSSITMSQTDGPLPGEELAAGTYIIRYDISNHGSSTYCNITVQINDKVAPVAKCTAVINTYTFNSSDLLRPNVSWVDDGSYDPCNGTITRKVYPTALKCHQMGEQVLTMVIYDAQGNRSECQSTVMILPAPPLCQDISVQLEATGEVSISSDDIFIGTGNACGVNSLSLDKTDFSCDDVGENIVTLTATNSDNNTSTCQAIITITDEGTPEVLCKGTTVQLGQNGLANITVDDINNGANDVCGLANLSLSLGSFTCSNIGDNTVSLTATDVNGNANSCQATVTVLDEVAPITLCQDITVQLDDNGLASITLNEINNGSNDACGLANLSLDNTSFDCSNVGDNKVSLTATDVNGNVNSCEATVTILDEVAPMALCQDITVQLDENGLATISGEAIDSGSNDACGISTMSLDQSSFNCDHTGSNTVILGITDNNGNTSNCQATVTVLDEVAPVALCQDVIIQLDNNGRATISETAIDNGSNDACGISALSLDQTAFSCEEVGENIVTLSVTDPNNNTSICQATITVVDEVAPEVLCQDVTVQLDDKGLASITLNEINNGSNDACGLANLSLDNTSFDCSNVGDNKVTLTATDVNGNVNSCEATVTILDEVAPMALCQDITVQLDKNGQTSISGEAIDSGSNDACGISTMSLDQSSFNCDHTGSNTVILSITDNNGNTSNCQVTVTVLDEVAPVALCQDITIQLDNNGRATISEAAIDNGSNDACGISALSLDQTAFSCEEIGENIVTLSATDPNNNTSICQATITVVDEVAPEVLCQDVTVQLDDNGLASITLNEINNGSNDACGLANLSLDNTSFDCSNVGENTVTLSVTDNNGNANNCQATVTVLDEVAPSALCQNITVQLDATGQATISEAAIDNSSNDACGIAALSLDQSSFNCDQIGDNIVLLSVTDNNGNNSSCQATVTVLDEVAPSALCQNITVQLDENGQASISEAEIDNGSDDACGMATMSLDQVNFTCDQTGDNTVTLTLTDNNGNSVDCQATVTVVDDIKPTLSCPQDMVVDTDPGECGAYVSLPKAAPADNCGIKNLKSRYRALDEAGSPVGSWSSWANDQSGFFELGTYQIQWRTQDQSNNERFCSFTLNIIDEEAPEVVCQEVTINFNGEETIAIAPSSVFDEAASFDACGGVSFVSQSLSEVSCENVGQSLGVQVIGVDPNGNTSSCIAQISVVGMPCDFEATDIDCEQGAAADYDPEEEAFTLSADDCSGYPQGEFSFVGTELCGDGEITVRVSGLAGDGRAGVVMMESTDPGSRRVSMLKSQTRQVTTEYRTSTNGNLRQKHKNRSGVKWVKIVRIGNKFKTYTSTNGSSWKHAHTIDYSNFADCVYAGIMTYSRRSYDPVTATFDQLIVTSYSNTARATLPTGTSATLEQVSEQSRKNDFHVNSLHLTAAPNPFSDQTQIEFELTGEEEVTLEVYNLQGQRVKRLIDTHLPAGIYQEIWRGTDTQGHVMPSGVYLLRLQVGQKSLSKKVSFITK